MKFLFRSFAVMNDSKLFKTVCCYFEEQARQNPNNTAIYLNEDLISYWDFNQRANQYAHFLKKRGLRRNSLVGIQLMRSVDLLVAIFAVIKAGGAYLPLDPLAPVMRNKTILEDANRQFLIIDEDHCLTEKNASFDKINLQIISIRHNVGSEPTCNLNLLRGKNDLAYVMYTSGTTGKPKGAMISHRALVNRILWMQHTFPLDRHAVLFHKTYPCFDVSVYEILWWSIAGAGVVLLPPQKEHDIKLYIAMIERYQITAMHMVPSILRLFLSYIQVDYLIPRLQSLKYLFSSGESLDAKEVNLFNYLFHKQETRLINLYGPTEATIDVSYFICDKFEIYRKIPIGKAIHNITLWVLDEQLNLSDSEPGELYISGVGLAQGYLNNPVLTKAAFLDNPYLPGEKMYRTGDRVYWGKDNQLMFLSRKDDQVKLHGQRIELEEIRYHLIAHPYIQSAVVICEKRAGLDDVLLAFLTTHDQKMAFSSTEINAFLKTWLPDYMLPAHYYWLDVIPVKDNGKIDRSKLLSFV